MSEGEEAHLWLDTSRIHYFDAETGENLIRAADELPSGRGSDGNGAGTGRSSTEPVTAS